MRLGKKVIARRPFVLRRRHESRSMVFVGLLVASVALFVPLRGATQSVPARTQTECVSFPTVECTFDLALDAAEQITWLPALLDAYVYVGKAQVQAGETEDAEDTSARALIVAKTIAETDVWTLTPGLDLTEKERYIMGYSGKAGALVSILELQAALGQVAAAQESFAIALEAIASGTALSSRHRLDLLESIARVGRAIGDPSAHEILMATKISARIRVMSSPRSPWLRLRPVPSTMHSAPLTG